MDDQKKVQEMINEINQLQQQGETISQQIEQLNISLNDITSAVKGMEGAVGKETLIPIGAGCFITTELKSEDVLVGVGADVAIKKSREETVETLKKDKEEVEKLIKQLTEQLQNINEYIAQKRPEAERLMKETGVQ